MGDWVLDGGRLSIDLLNTVRDRALVPRETLHTPGDLALWLREADLPYGGGEVGEDALTAARRLRAAIDTLSQGGGDGVPAPVGPVNAVAVVNAMAAGAPSGPRLALNGEDLMAVPPEPSVAAALGRIARDAIDLLTGGERVRVCAADDCGIRFADRSPAQNRQWCSMRRCGNRTKARRHYIRTTG